MKIDLKRYTPKFVIERKAALMKAAGNRNAEMMRYEDMYRMDVYQSGGGHTARLGDVGVITDANEWKISLPLAFAEVEKHKAMMWAKPPTITVPYAGADVGLAARAQKLERFLYGVMEATRLTSVVVMVEWSANCRGRGWLKATYDETAAYDEFPIRICDVDPKNIYCTWNEARERPTELIEIRKRTRRSVRDMYGEKALVIPEARLSKKEQWLDEEIEIIDLWAEHVVWEDEEASEDEYHEEAEAVPLVIELAAASTLAAMNGPRPARPTDTLGARLATKGKRRAEQREAKEPKRVRVRKVVHGVLAVGEGAADGGVWVKKPVVIPGYMYVPYFGLSGHATPLDGGRDALSLLYPYARGDAGEDVQGVFQAMNTLASLLLQNSVEMSTAPLVTDDPNAQIDTATPNFLNRLEPGRTLQYLQKPNTLGALGNAMEFLKGVMYQVGMPEILAAGRTASLSGQSVEAQGAEYEMRLALRQREREQALEMMFKHVLCLARAWADPDEGWTVSGSGRYGRSYYEETLLPSDIGKNYRVKVKLSSSTPRDVMGLISMLLNAKRSNEISAETFLDQLQQHIGLASDSPEDEIKKILRGMFITSGKLTEQIAEQLGSEYVARLTGEVGGIPTPPPPRPQPAAPQAGPTQPPPPPEMSMAGMPITPQLVAAMGNPEGAMNMAEGSAEGLANGG